MKLLLRNACSLAAFVFSGTAFAGTLNLSPGACAEEVVVCWTISGDNSQPDAGDLAAIIGGGITVDDLNQLYKSEFDTGDEFGPFSDDYNTAYADNGPEDAWITWLEGDSIDCSEGCFLVVKDGNHAPSVYIFDISAWNGTDTIDLTGFWADKGAISNVSIWGGDSSTVPEPGTLTLFGLGLIGMGLMRRRRII